ncbi:crotonobetaine/carnitine-CoA ligase [Neobacillus niacini]|uniref:AMP-binding protein n=1 Tax=Neobacillus niacini TaxID=86668 RepID=UPI00286791E0|nr:AMP-binding protein [Neobacillus niacini]MDR7079765.1 crotonobetaine/carnitine-CoA ligase [Neobacillus niacini]
MIHSFIESLPYEQRVLSEMLDRCFENNESSVFYVSIDEKNREVTYAEMKEKVDIVASNLLDLGIKKGTNVAVLMASSTDYISVWFALAKIGAIEVPINTVYKGETLQYLINDSDARYIVVDEEYYAELNKISAGLEKIQYVISHGQNDYSYETSWNIVGWERVTKYSEVRIRHLFNEINNNPVYPHDPVGIIYTSGTTGPSKGVLLSNHHLVFMGLTHAGIMHYKEDDISLNFLPYYHTAAKFVTMACMLSGAKMILKKKFSITSFWNDVHEHQVTLLSSLGGVLPMLYNQKEKEDDVKNSIRAVYVIPSPKDNYYEIQNRFGLKLVVAYGGTEWNIVSSTELDEDKPGSAGRHFEQYYDLKIVDEHDFECSQYEQGEIIVRPKIPHIVMLEYYNKPEKTVEAWRGLWFRTGDRAYKDKDGYIYFVDRLKDAIRRRGENISSFEIESVVDKHPQVIESAVIPVPADVGEDEIKACIILKKGADVSHQEIFNYCYENMGYFMVPRYIEFFDDFPRTPTGKTRKNILREQGKRGMTRLTWDREKDGGIKVTSKGIDAIKETQ